MESDYQMEQQNREERKQYVEGLKAINSAIDILEQSSVMKAMKVLQDASLGTPPHPDVNFLNHLKDKKREFEERLGK